MSRIVAFDGGGTKTQCAVFDFEGRCLYDAIGPGTNHQSLGVAHVTAILQKMFLTALETLSLEREHIAHVYLGLSGADRPEDFKRLNHVCHDVFKPLPFTVTNDAWIIMRSALKKPYGAVAIAGTGTNAAAINAAGQRAILRAISYTLGTYGGGLDLAREAMHHACRDDEMIGEKTMLKDAILKHFNVNDMERLIDLFYPTMQVDRQTFGALAGLVNQCANAGDRIAQNILIKNGHIMAEQTIGVIRQVGLVGEAFPVVLGGKVFSGESPLLIDTFQSTLHQRCPKAWLVRPVCDPVVGAYLAALDQLGIQQDAIIDKRVWKGRSLHG